MPIDKVLFFCVSGQRFTNRTNVYSRLKTLLPEKYPDLADDFAFLGNPFKKLPFPLMWDKEEREEDPTTRLFACWTDLNRFCVGTLRPALEAKQIIVVDGFGLDALLYSTAMVESSEQNDEARRLHSNFVASRLYEQQIPAPEYFITSADTNVVDNHLMKKHPLLKRIPILERRAFIRYEERAISEYFIKIKYQKTPNYIDASLTVEQMAESVALIVGNRIHQRSHMAA
jgi:hypothetical protein